MTGPTPVIFSSSCLSAVLVFILPDCSGVVVAEGEGPKLIEGDGVGVGTGVADNEGVDVRTGIWVVAVAGDGVGNLVGVDLITGPSCNDVGAGDGKGVRAPPRFDLFEDPRSNLLGVVEGLNVMAASVILADCCSG